MFKMFQLCFWKKMHQLLFLRFKIIRLKKISNASSDVYREAAPDGYRDCMFAHPVVSPKRPKRKQWQIQLLQTPKPKYQDQIQTPLYIILINCLYRDFPYSVSLFHNKMHKLKQILKYEMI